MCTARHWRRVATEGRGSVGRMVRLWVWFGVKTSWPIMSVEGEGEGPGRWGGRVQRGAGGKEVDGKAEGAPGFWL